MTPSQMRAELLAQHANIRELIETIRGLAVRGRRGDPVGDTLRAGVLRLTAAFLEHNVREEELLGPIIATIDAWGPVRAEIMDEAHVHEHEALRKAIAGIPGTPSEFAAADVEALFDRILGHMAREEETLLAEDVLRDDFVVIEFGG